MRVGVLSAALVAVVVALAAGASGAGATGSHALRTGVFDPSVFVNHTKLAVQRTKDAGGSLVRLEVDWAAISPSAPATPENAADPRYSGYDWTILDREVKLSVENGVSPILDLDGAPHWAYTTDPGLPDIAQLRAFATALAQRYSGSNGSLPRVQNFMFWNEPNLSTNLKPQTAAAVDWYRDALNAFAAVVHGVHPDNVVIAGALAPFEEKPGPGVSTTGLAPMTFIRMLTCMSAAATPKPTCKNEVDADAWSFHPYTYGGPTDHATSPNDISLGDVPRAEALLRAAQKAGNLRSHGAVQFWVTEISWDTSPPDPKGVPLALQARWTSEALYHLASDDVSVVIWFLLRDLSYPSQPFQSGLYFNGSDIQHDHPKPTLQAFRFPFVAETSSHGYTLWGRTPTSKGASVTIELKSGSHWKKVKSLRANGAGIFQGAWATTTRVGYVRARIGTDASIPFSLKAPPDHRYSPFGSG